MNPLQRLLSRMKWINEPKEGKKPLSLFDPELKISEDAKNFITAVLDRLEQILKSTIIWKGDK
jgi:hypothetical protein